MRKCLYLNCNFCARIQTGLSEPAFGLIIMPLWSRKRASARCVCYAHIVGCPTILRYKTRLSIIHSDARGWVDRNIVITLPIVKIEHSFLCCLLERKGRWSTTPSCSVDLLKDTSKFSHDGIYAIRTPNPSACESMGG